MMWMLLIAALPVDHDGRTLPRYLDVATAQTTVAQLSDALSDCAPTGVQTATVSTVVVVGSSGEVTDVTLSPQAPGNEGVLTCWRDVLEHAPFAAHDEPSVSVRFTIYIRQGSVLTSPTVELVEREVGPVLLFLSPLTNAVDRARAAEWLMSAPTSEPTGDPDR
jgi:hypothetical protein